MKFFNVYFSVMFLACVVFHFDLPLTLPHSAFCYTAVSLKIIRIYLDFLI
jgi:hypothetical protein